MSYQVKLIFTETKPQQKEVLFQENKISLLVSLPHANLFTQDYFTLTRKSLLF